MKITMADIYTQSHYITRETETGKRLAYKDYWKRLWSKKRSSDSYEVEHDVLQSLNIR